MRWYHGDINIGYRHSTDGGARWFMMVAYSPKGLFLGEMARIGEEKKSNLSHQPATDWNLLYIDIHVRHITYTSTVCKKNMLHMNLYIHQITPNDLYIYIYIVLVKGYKKPIHDPSCAISFESGAFGHACMRVFRFLYRKYMYPYITIIISC